jgi:hypothetical protein
LGFFYEQTKELDAGSVYSVIQRYCSCIKPRDNVFHMMIEFQSSFGRFKNLKKLEQDMCISNVVPLESEGYLNLKYVTWPGFFFHAAITDSNVSTSYLKELILDRKH